MTAEVNNKSDNPWFWVGVAAVISIVVVATMYFAP